jgi:hypothetical protein
MGKATQAITMATSSSELGDLGSISPSVPATGGAACVVCPLACIRHVSTIAAVSTMRDVISTVPSPSPCACSVASKSAAPNEGGTSRRLETLMREAIRGN